MSIAGVTLACRALGIPTTEHVRANVLPFVTPVAVGGSVFFLLRQIGYPSGYLALALHAGLASVAYLASSWFLVANTVERTFVKARVLRRQVTAKSALAASLGTDKK